MTPPPQSEPATFDFDGREIPYLPGQTVGAALIAAGITAWRTTRVHGRPRGLFCGIGICQDCLVQIDGTPNLRACLAVAHPGVVVRTQVGTGWEDREPPDDAPIAAPTATPDGPVTG